MHELYKFACDELKLLEVKASKGVMSQADLSNAFMLVGIAKDILKHEKLKEEGYSADGMNKMRDPSMKA